MKPVGDGAKGTVADHLASVARQTGKNVVDAKKQDILLPYDAAHVWDIYQEITRTRQPGFVGVGPVTHQEIAAWMQCYRVRLDPWEVEAILLLDVVFRGIVLSKPSPSPSTPPRK